MRNKCDICGKEFEGYGNNPAPLDGKICCDKCNVTYVIPARLKKLNVGNKLGDSSIKDAETETPQITELRNRIGFLISEEVIAINDYDEALKTANLSEEQRKTLEEIRNDKIDHTNKLNEIYKGLMTGAVEGDLTEDASNLKESFAGGYDPATINTELEKEPNVEESDVRDGIIETVSNVIENIGNLSTAAEDDDQDVQETLKENELTETNKTRFVDSIKDETVTKTVNLGRYNRYDTLVMKKANDYGLKLWGEKNVAEVTGRPEDIKLFVDFLNNHHSAGARITDSDTVNDIGEVTVGSKYRFEEKYGSQPLTVTELGETVKLSLDNSKTYLRISREKFEDMIRTGRLDNIDTTTIEQYGAVKAGDRRIGDFKSEELVNRIRTKFNKLGKDKIQQYVDQLKAKGGYRDLSTRLTADLIDMTIGSSDISDWYYEFDVNDDHIMRAGKDAIKRMGIRL
jgi:ribosomal protein S13